MGHSSAKAENTSVDCFLDSPRLKNGCPQNGGERAQPHDSYLCHNIIYIYMYQLMVVCVFNGGPCGGPHLGGDSCPPITCEMVPIDTLSRPYTPEVLETGLSHRLEIKHRNNLRLIEILP